MMERFTAGERTMRVNAVLVTLLETGLELKMRRNLKRNKNNQNQKLLQKFLQKTKISSKKLLKVLKTKNLLQKQKNQRKKT